MFEKDNGIDDHDHYGDPDVPRSDDLYKRCKHDRILSECPDCEEYYPTNEDYGWSD